MTLDEWMVTVAAELDLGELSGESATDIAAVRTELLDLARDAAHAVARPAAPLTTFLLGVAVGRGGGLAANAAAIRSLLPAATASTPQPQPSTPQPQPGDGSTAGA